MPLCCPDNSETLSGCFRNQCPDAAEILNMRWQNFPAPALGDERTVNYGFSFDDIGAGGNDIRLSFQGNEGHSSPRAGVELQANSKPLG